MRRENKEEVCQIFMFRGKGGGIFEGDGEGIIREMEEDL